MTEFTIADILIKIKRDLDWRGPNDRALGYVCLERKHAEYLHRLIIDIIKERDELVYTLDREKSNV